MNTEGKILCIEKIFNYVVAYTGREKERKFIKALTLINGRFVFGVALNVLGKPLIKFLM